MENYQDLVTQYLWIIPLIIVLSVWDIVWKLLGLWKSARNNESIWFILIAIFNTLGILPIIYILLNKNKKDNTGTN